MTKVMAWIQWLRKWVIIIQVKSAITEEWVHIPVMMIRLMNRQVNAKVKVVRKRIQMNLKRRENHGNHELLEAHVVEAEEEKQMWAIECLHRNRKCNRHLTTIIVRLMDPI